MRIATLLACGTVAAVTCASAATAGEPTVTSSGDFAVVDVEVHPPVTSERGEPQGVRLDIREFVGNRETGDRPAITGAVGFRFQHGMRFRGRLFAKCDVDAAAPEDCPARSRVGRGSIEIDARPAAPDPVTLELLAYNGTRRDGRATVLFFALAGDAVFGKQVGELRRDATGPFGTVLAFAREESPPPYTITQLRLRTVNRTVTRRRDGRRVRRHLIEAPRACDGSWSFASYQELADGTLLEATDTTACVRR